MPDLRINRRTSLHHRHRLLSCHLGSSLQGAAVPADTASADRTGLVEDHIVLVGVRTGLVVVRRGRADLAGRGSGYRRSSLVDRRPGCSMKVACRPALDRRRGELAPGFAGMPVAHLPEELLVHGKND